MYSGSELFTEIYLMYSWCTYKMLLTGNTSFVWHKMWNIIWDIKLLLWHWLWNIHTCNYREWIVYDIYKVKYWINCFLSLSMIDLSTNMSVIRATVMIVAPIAEIQWTTCYIHHPKFPRPERVNPLRSRHAIFSRFWHYSCRVDKYIWWESGFYKRIYSNQNL